MQKKIEVSVIVVHYGHGNEVIKCLKNLDIIRKKFKQSEFILVDNNDEKLDKNKIKKNYPWIKYIETPKNLGWGGGRNFGIKESKGKYILSLDSDILIDLKSFKHVYEIIKKNKKIGLVSPQIKNISGKFHSQATRELTPLTGLFFESVINKIFPNSPVVKNFLMSSWDRKTSRYVDVGQLGGFIMRREAYDEIGGFDENIFLYFEENDVSDGLKKHNWKIFFDASSEVTHLESKGTAKDSEKIKNIFNHSRFYYFRKHYGLIPALIVEFFARISKFGLAVLGIFLLGTFLRFYRFMPNFVLGGEMGTDYMNIWNMIHGTRTFLIGPRTSHEWFFISPIAYWIYVVLFLIWNYNLVSINVFWGMFSSLSILICYFTVKKIFNKNIALISSFLMSISPTWLVQTRSSRYNLVAAVLFLPYLLYLKNSIEDHGKSLFKLGLILGLTMSFFPSPLLLIPATIVCFIFYKVKPKFKYIVHFILAFLIPNITFLIYEVSDKFAITIQLLEWIPYRILGFFGLYHKNTANSGVLLQNIHSIYQFFSETYLGYENTFSLILFVLVIICTSILVIKHFKNKNKEIAFLLLVINLVVCYIGLFVHGDPPEHYYYVIFPIPLILVAYIFDKIFKNKYLLIVSTFAFAAIGIFGIIKMNWFYQDLGPINYSLNQVPYSIQLAVTNKILRDSEGRKFSLGRIGAYDEFGNNFADNYTYLLTIRGAKIDNNSKLKYLIVEGSENYKDIKATPIFSENQVEVFKE
jgi:GT2 family glycosyltransferase